MTILVYNATTGAIQCAYTFTPDQATPANIQANVPAGSAWVQVADGDSAIVHQSAFTVSPTTQQITQTATSITTPLGPIPVPSSGGPIIPPPPPPRSSTSSTG